MHSSPDDVAPYTRNTRGRIIQKNVHYGYYIIIIITIVRIVCTLVVDSNNHLTDSI